MTVGVRVHPLPGVADDHQRLTELGREHMSSRDARFPAGCPMLGRGRATQCQAATRPRYPRTVWMSRSKFPHCGQSSHVFWSVTPEHDAVVDEVQHLAFASPRPPAPRRAAGVRPSSARPVRRLRRPASKVVGSERHCVLPGAPSAVGDRALASSRLRESRLRGFHQEVLGAPGAQLGRGGGRSHDRAGLRPSPGADETGRMGAQADSTESPLVTGMLRFGPSCSDDVTSKPH